MGKKHSVKEFQAKNIKCLIIKIIIIITSKIVTYNLTRLVS